MFTHTSPKCPYCNQFIPGLYGDGVTEQLHPGGVIGGVGTGFIGWDYKGHDLICSASKCGDCGERYPLIQYPEITSATPMLDVIGHKQVCTGMKNTILDFSDLEIPIVYTELNSGGFNCKCSLIPNMIGTGATLEEAEASFKQAWASHTAMIEIDVKSEIDALNTAGYITTSSHVSINMKKIIKVTKATQDRVNSTPELRQYFINFLKA